MRRTLLRMLLLLGLVSSLPAVALPRFAARNGMECIQCHVNPTGGGMRNAYGRNVFENVFLPWGAKPRPDSWIATDFPEEPKEEQVGKVTSGFSPELTEWLAVGADLRAAYLLIRPDRLNPDGTRPLVNSFFLMQADLYHSAQLGDAVTLYLDVGVYTGFEAWGLLRVTPPSAGFELYLKAGRFLPPFGIREVEHQLFTREAVGFGQTDKDTGLELDAFWGPLSASVALLNGTLGDTALDSSGTERRLFEKAVSARLALRGRPLGIRAQLGGSFYFSDNNNGANPLLASALPTSLASEIQRGVNEMRGGLFLTLNRGRFTYLGDLVAVRDTFNSDAVASLAGYASYQELSFVPVQGLELVATHEFMDADLDIAGTSQQRAGLVVEFFPAPFTEVRAMARRTFGTVPGGPRWDLVLFLHLFM